MSAPRDFTVNGLGRIGITLRNQDGLEPLQENSLEFTGLAFAIHAGLSIPEKPEGRQALQRVGLVVVQEWTRAQIFRFGGDPNLMPRYVDEFLLAVRRDFPRVIVGGVQGPDVIAETRRMRGWNGDLFRFDAKHAAGIYYNLSHVTRMASAARQSSDGSSEGRKMGNRFRSFLFLLAVATTHELTHVFITYLAQGQDVIESYTPPEVSYLNYIGLSDGDNHPMTGESGRWLESRLFGGSIEFYRDSSDDSGQAGIPYILDSEGLARKIQPACVLQLVTRVNEFRTFPFETTGRPMTYQQRRAKGLLSLGSTEATGQQVGGTFMRPRRERPQRLYNIPVSELSRVPLEPRRALRVRQVA
ncbi:Stem cell self-renewal Piwi [Fusarium globosum]|uniref:Stem cell self-renewal Piwi n=1 Tax=Fusarium globosum TaxID=78864 RepID=A0A8H5Z0F5_9HYPO|nr:Stem cell self-renewal Piwi [Fusarium globosum]